MVLKLLFFIIVTGTISVRSEILPDVRRTQWSPGVPGGIPEVSALRIDVTDYGADRDGRGDCSGAVIQALNALPSDGGVIYFPRGTYTFKSTVTVGKDNITFRGEGVGKTRLLHDHDGLCFDVVIYKRGSWQKVLSGASAGSKSVTVEDGSKFIKGGFAEIRQANDSTIMYTDPEWIQSWADSAVGQLFEVADISGNTVTFRSQLHFSFDQEFSPQIRPQGFVTNVGFENFYIERVQTGNSTFQFKNAAYCWVRNIESYHTRKSHITNNTTIGCEFRDSYFHRSYSYGGGGSGYGVEFGYHCTDGLCENNVFDSLRHAMMVHLGTSGTVFGYNYSLHPVQAEGETDLNNGWVPPDVSLHGHYAQMNLFESNIVEEIGVSDYWGPMGPGNTFLRNVVKGEGVFIYDHSHRQNFIGNVLTKWVTDSTSDEVLRHGERVNGVLLWDKTISDDQIPDSYYLRAKPGFYDSMEWPSTGSDLSENTLPAAHRYQLYTHPEFKSVAQLQKLREVKIKTVDNTTMLIRSSQLSGVSEDDVVLTTVDGKNIRATVCRIEPDAFLVRDDYTFHSKAVIFIWIRIKTGMNCSMRVPFLK